MLKNPFGSKSVSVLEATDIMTDSSGTLIDVRTPEEWSLGHAPLASHMPMASLRQQMVELPKDRPILVICQSGARSARAVASLKREGYDAHNVKGGMNAWARAGLDVTRS